jgi:two-component system OmpR family response regulator
MMTLAQQDGNGAPRRRRVLIVEDDANLRHVLAKICRANGMEVVAVATAGEGLKALELRPALVILDLSLPDGPGIPVLERIRADRLAVNVLVTTDAAANSDLLAAAAALRPDRILKKPFGLLDFTGWMHAAA